jgi:hypothetical protein
MIQQTENIKTLFWNYHSKMVELEGLIVTLNDLIIKELQHTEPISMFDIILKKVGVLNALLQNNRYEDLKIRFPNILWASVFVTSFSSTESVLDELCINIRNEFQIALSQSDLKSKGITRSQIYLTKVAKLDLSSHSKEWDALKKSNIVRNCLTHTDGIIEDSQDKDSLRQIIRQDHTLSDVDGHLVISKQFALNFIDVSKKLLSGITGIELP